MKSGSRKKSGSAPSGDAGDKDRLIAELKDRVSILEKELRLKQEEATSPDIIERKRADEALRLTQFALDNFRDSAIWLTLDGSIVYVNLEACRSLGYSRDELLTMHIWDIDPDYPPERMRGLLPDIRQGFCRKFESRHVARDGRAFPVEVTCSYTRYGDKECLIAFDRDITERKRIERELRLTQFSVDRASDEIFWLESDGRVAYVNDETCRVMGYSREELQNMYVWDFDPTFSPEKWLVSFSDLKNKGFLNFETEHKTRDGRVFPVEITANYIEYDDRAYSFAFVRDIAERKRAGEALRESEEKYRFLVENSKDVIWKMDLQERWTFVSGNVEGVTGYKPEEMAGKPIWDFIAPECHESIREKLLKRMRGEDIPTYTTWTINKAGDHIPIEVATTPITDKGGKIVGVQGISRDITERMRAEEALRESEKKFRVLAETSPVAIFLYQGGKYVYVNPMAEALTGYSRDELLAWDAWGWIHPEYQELVKGRARKRQLGEPLPNRYEVKYRAKDGREGWVDFSAGVIEHRGKPAGLAMVLDITQRKQAEEGMKGLLRDLGERVKELSALHGAYGIMQKGTSTPEVLQEVANILPSAWQYPEITAARIVFDGREFMAPNFRESPWVQRAEFYTAGGGHGAIEVYYLEGRPDEAEGPFLKEERALINSLAEMLRIFFDKRYAEEALKEAKQQAELYLDLMGHDINNLNQIALGYLEMAIDAAGDNEVKTLIEKPLAAIGDSSKLIENVRKLRKAEAGGLKLEAVDLDGLLIQLRGQYSNVPGREVAIDYTPYRDCHVTANGLLRDVFGNLIGNAIKHSDPSKPVWIGLKLERCIMDGREYCLVTVEDDGPGIPDAQKEGVFARSRKENAKARGKGLGLYLVKSLVEDFHGTVRVEDRIKGDHTKGTRFAVMLPAIEK